MVGPVHCPPHDHPYPSTSSSSTLPSCVPATTSIPSSTSSSISPTTPCTPSAPSPFFSTTRRPQRLLLLRLRPLPLLTQSPLPLPLLLLPPASLLPIPASQRLRIVLRPQGVPLNIGRAIHTHSVEFFVHWYLNVATALLDMFARSGDVNGMQVAERKVITLTVMVTCYTKEGTLESTQEVFEGMGERVFVCWNAMTTGYVQHGRLDKVRGCLGGLSGAGCTGMRSRRSRCCWKLRGSSRSRWGVGCICTIENNRIGFNVQVGTTLVDMYSKCRSLEDACLVFDKIHDKDVAAWNSMIGEYVMHRQSQKVLKLFTKLRSMDDTYNVHQSVENASSHAALVNEG